MYVCICKQVTDREIKQAINNGVATLRELNQQLGVGSHCGKCCKFACELIKTHPKPSIDALVSAA